ncbi:DUF5615 family PIN-like protein [Larkinella terrae]|uniref:DUF5615 family PIN-like protein n=1 Tax=Larkinella terrae TaxID=2025311 RepID=UPI0034D96E8F
MRDADVIESSRNPPRIILTEDKDFGEWVFSHQVNDISVIFLRYHFKDTQEITNTLVASTFTIWRLTLITALSTFIKSDSLQSYSIAINSYITAFLYDIP